MAVVQLWLEPFAHFGRLLLLVGAGWPRGDQWGCLWVPHGALPAAAAPSTCPNSGANTPRAPSLPQAPPAEAQHQL